MISNKVIQFIKENIQLIDDEKFEELYDLCANDKSLAASYTGELTQVLLDSGIDPLVGMTEVPIGFLDRSTSIKSFTVPDTIISVGSWAFYGCSIENIIIPNSVKTIEEQAFGMCQMSEILLPSVEVIHNQAFASCENLKTVSVSTSLKYIHIYAFGNCKNLQNINYTGTTEQWKEIQKGKLWHYDAHNFIIRCRDGNIHIN